MAIILAVLGVVIVYFAYSVIFSRIWDKELYADIRFETGHAVCGEDAVLVETITNRKMFPIPVVNIKFHIDRSLVYSQMENVSLSDKTYKNDIFSLLMYQKITRKLVFNCKRRGFYRLDSMDVIAINMFNDRKYIKPQALDSGILVYPAYTGIDRLDVPFRRIMGNLQTKRDLLDDPFTFRGIREYQGFDTMKSINWKATAKTGELKVNLYESTTEQEVMILLDLEQETVLFNDALVEEGISLAATLAELFISKSIPTGLVTDGRDVETKEEVRVVSGCGRNHVYSVLTELARIDTKLRMRRFSEVLDDMGIFEEDVSYGSRGDANHINKYRNHDLYILISSDKGRKAQERFKELCRVSPGSKWIITYHPDMAVEGLESEDVILWEVPYVK